MQRTVRSLARAGVILAFAGAGAVPLPVSALEQGATVPLGEAPWRQCASMKASIRSRNPEDAQSMCAGADAAIQFFRTHGVSLDEPVSIDLVEELPPVITRLAVGCFSRPERRSYVLSYEKFAARKYWLGLQVNRRLYETVASHEVAHAIASCVAASTQLTTEATEYLAFVSMFETMDPPAASEVLSAYPGQVFESFWEINELVYGLNPIRFGVMSYRHYLAQSERSAFIRDVFSGVVLAPRYLY